MRATLVAVLAAVRSSVRARAELEAEILALRHQLAVLQQAAPKRPRLSRADRLLWVLLSRVWNGWRRTIQIVQPATSSAGIAERLPCIGDGDHGGHASVVPPSRQTSAV
jgi:hypothetical protein